MSLLFCIPGCHFLQPQEQLFVKGWTDASVDNGPGFKVVSGTKVASKRNGITLGPTQYLLIEDSLTGTSRIEVGPGLFFLGAYDRSLGQKEALALKHNQYVKLHDKVSGVIKVVKGEGLVFLQPEEVELDGGVKNAIEIDDRRSVLIRELDSGQLKLITEKQLFFPTALQQIIEIREPQVLDVTDYLHIKDLRNGEVSMVQGPCRFFPGPYEEIQKRGVAVSLKHNQYVKVLDTRSGIISVVRGEHVLFPGPFDRIQGGIQQAYEVDEHDAVLIRNTQTGQQELLTDPQLFFPTWDQEVLEVRKRIVLEDHEVMIIKEKDGRYRFHSGANPEQRSFFLPPYCEVEEVSWSTGLMLEDHSKKMSRFDMRPQFLTYEFTARTCDNVELILDVTFFWQILNVEKMIRKTEDAPGDLCAHARSNIIQSVSKATLEKFLSEFNPIARAAIFDADDSFYDERGFVIHRVEVRQIKCKDPNTEKVLQEIIQETTNRLKSLQKQQSENEVKIFKLKGEIAEEKLNGDLLSIRHQHHRAAALMEGEAEADRVQAFLSGIENAPLDTKVGLFNTLRKCDALNSIAKKNTTMYFTPSDVNLSIETVQSVRALPPLAEVSEDAVTCS